MAVVVATAITAIQMGHTKCIVIAKVEEETVLAEDYHLSTKLTKVQLTHAE